MERVTCTIRVEGRVQGVFFRATTQEEAARLGLSGTVRNLPDGSVEVVATGDRDRVDRLIGWCRRGPAFARVDSVGVRWHDAPIDFEGFRVVR